MRRATLSALCLVLLAGPLWADLRIVGETKVRRDRMIRLSVEGKPDKAALLWRYDKKKLDGGVSPDGRVWLVGPPGEYAVECVSILLDKDGRTVIEEAAVTLTVEGAPDPAPPVPPVPPNPPVPPTPAGALRVLVVYESADLPKLPAAQQAMIFDAKVRAALKDRTDKAGPDARGWNIWDKDTDVSQTAKFWQDAMKRPRSATPFVHVFKGDVPVFEGPLPADAPAMLDLLTKYGG